MDIAAMSMNMSMANVDQQVGIAVAKKAMDFAETQAASLIEDMEQTNASFGHQLDVRV